MKRAHFTWACKASLLLRNDADRGVFLRCVCVCVIGHWINMKRHLNYFDVIRNNQQINKLIST